MRAARPQHRGRRTPVARRRPDRGPRPAARAGPGLPRRRGRLRRPAHRRRGRRAPGRPRARPPSRRCTPTARPGWRRSPTDLGCPRPATRWRPRARSPRSSATTTGSPPCWRRHPRAPPTRWPRWSGDRRPGTWSGPGATSTPAARRSPVEWLLAHALLVGHRHRHRGAAARGGAAPARRPGAPGGRAGAAGPRHVAGRHRATSTGRPRGPPPTRCGWSRSCWSCGRPTRPRCCAPAASACASGPGRPQTLDVDETRLALLVETAHAAGLLAAGDDGRDTAEVWLPTPAYDGWLDDARSPSRWLVLAQAWLTSTRVPGLVGGRDQRGRTLSPLGPDLDRTVAPAVRAAVLADLAALPDRRRATTSESLSARLRWQAPRRGGRLQDELVTWTVTEARTLGPGHRRGARRARPAARGRRRRGAVSRARARRCRRPLDHVLLQADLTAVAPGPLEPALARSLRLVADVESTGGATVYRFTEATVRRAFDAGWTAGDVTGLLGPALAHAGAAAADLPGRRRRRAGTAGSGWARRRRSSGATTSRPSASCSATGGRRRCGLRLIAPTVLASSAPADVVLDRLRAHGAGAGRRGPGRRRRRPAPRVAAHHARRPPARVVTDAAAARRRAAGRRRPGDPRRRPVPAGRVAAHVPAHRGRAGDAHPGRRLRRGALDRLRRRRGPGHPAGRGAGRGRGRLPQRLRPPARRGPVLRGAPDHRRLGAGRGDRPRREVADAPPRV